MSSLSPHEEQSPLFNLPAETRLLIYSHLIPKDGIYIDLCTPRNIEGADFTVRKRSVVSTLMLQMFAIDAVSRGSGLHLLLVSRRTKAEILPLLARTTVRFHCSKCFDELLKNLSYGLGVGVRWIKHIEIILDLTSQMSRWQTLTVEVGKTMARETMGIARKTGYLYWGRLDLTERERWRFEPIVEEAKGEDAEGEANGDEQQQTMLSLFLTPGVVPQQQRRVPQAPERWLISGWFD